MISWTSLMGCRLLTNVKVAEAVGAPSETAQLLQKTTGAEPAWQVAGSVCHLEKLVSRNGGLDCRSTAMAFEKQSANSVGPDMLSNAVIAAAIGAELLVNRKVADEVARRKTECFGRQRMLTNVDIETGAVSRRTLISNLRKPQSARAPIDPRMLVKVSTAIARSDLPEASTITLWYLVKVDIANPSARASNLIKPNIRMKVRSAENLTKPDIEIAGLHRRLFDRALTDLGALTPEQLPVKTCHLKSKAGQSGHPKRGRTAASPRPSSRNANRASCTPKKRAGGRVR